LRAVPTEERGRTPERMTLSTLSVLAASFRRFNRDKCWTSAIVISYFALLCSIPLTALFFTAAARVLGDTEIALRSLNIFTDEFFARLDPGFFKRLGDLSGAVGKLWLFGVIGSLVAGSFLFSTLIATINHIFRTKYHKSFFYNRLMEYLFMLVIGIFMLFSLAMTAVWTAFGRTLQESELVRANINPEAIAVVNNVFLKYVIPYALTFLMFFILYKFIPEVKVHTWAGLIPAAVASLLFEVFKRLFAFYVVHFSAVGIVLNKLLQGTLTSIIFFLLWISASMLILLWGAELAAVLNEKYDAAMLTAPATNGI
jgi:membrane protein